MAPRHRPLRVPLVLGRAFDLPRDVASDRCRIVDAVPAERIRAAHLRIHPYVILDLGPWHRHGERGLSLYAMRRMQAAEAAEADIERDRWQTVELGVSRRVEIDRRRLGADRAAAGPGDLLRRGVVAVIAGLD